MDAQQFLAEFRHIANAPGGVARLRELVLQLAIQGKLIVPSESAETSSALLSQVRRIKSQLVAEKKLPREKPFPKVFHREVAADSPRHWRWAHFGELWQLLSGRDLEPNQYNVTRNGIPYITGASNIEFGVINVNRWTPEPVVISVDGDLLITCKGTIGKTAFNRIGDVHIARQIMAIRNFSGMLDSRFLKIWLDGFVGQLVKKSKSMIPGFSRDDLILAIYPVLPLKEQSRIVAKVDELMALCDQLEAQQQDRRKLQNALRQTTLQALASAQSPYELQDSWQRLQANFGCFFSEPEDVRELRLVVMELAIRGLLTEQLISDGDAAELVFAAPAAASSTRGRKRSAFFKEEISESDLPFALPKNWRWARLADIGYFLGGGTPSKSNPDYWQGPIPWVSPKDMKVARINSSQDHISEKALSESAAKLIPAGSLLVVVRGMILAHSFPVGLTSREVAINQDMKALCPHRSDMGEFLLLLLAGSKKRFLELVERSTHGTCRLETDRFASCVIGIPPLTEQLRIVESVNQLMLVCDALQSQLNEMRKCLATLAITSVANLTGITIEQEQDPCESPANSTDRPERHRQVLMKNL